MHSEPVLGAGRTFMRYMLLYTFGAYADSNKSRILQAVHRASACVFANMPVYSARSQHESSMAA